jgi:hypothetical protein
MNRPLSRSKFVALAIAATLALIPLASSPGRAAVSTAGPARTPDMLVTATASHGPGAAPSSNRVTIPLRTGPMPIGVPGIMAPTSPEVLTPQAVVPVSANQQGLTAGNSTPSDSTGAIGPGHYMEIINTQVAMYERTLTAAGSPVQLTRFVGASAGGSVFDPQIQWDQQAGRWIYAMDETYTTGNKLAFGWSRGGDGSGLTLANSDWCNFHVDTTTDFHDYPKLGHDANFILIGANVFANGVTFNTSSIWAIPKPAAGDTSCTAPIAAEFGTSKKPLMHLPPNSGLMTTPVPSNTADGAATGYISSISTTISTRFIGEWHVSPAAVGACTTPPCLVGDGEIAITLWSRPAAVPQPSPNPTLDPLDGRLTQAVQHDDPQAANAEAVWTQHTAAGAGGRTAVTWYELLPSLCASGVCGASAKRQEGVVANANLYIFNGAISPTSHGDAAVIHYNTSSATTNNDVRAQGRGSSDPLNTMSGETVLRGSTVPETDFSCNGSPQCRWGDYSGASPDPTSCSLVWGTNMLSGDLAGGSSVRWVTQNFALGEDRVHSAASTQQYVFNGSDGRTWTDMDAARLQLVARPTADSTGLITANADLFTSIAGVNQDLAVFVDVDGVPGASPVAWKESGGSAGTFSPNAAYAQAVFPMPAGHTYTVRLKWKAGVATTGTIFAGAGPIAGAGYSPTRLTLELFATSPPAVSVTTTQPPNTGSDGVTWLPIPGSSPLTLTPLADSRVVLGGNADLWTDTAGYNQDIGIFLSGGAITPPGQLLAWKESGGLSGTFSPNAAFVQTTVALTGGQTYTAELRWKANRRAPANATIYAGAGPLPGTSSYSPTSLTAVTLPAGPNPYENVITSQPALPNSNGATWSPMGVQVMVAATQCSESIVSANADLWTAQSGYNQDIAVFVTDNNGPQQLLVWKESGGSGGTFSPNAAFAETFFQMAPGHTYVFLLKWKTNRSAAGTGATIEAGAGPIAGQYSPTRLLVQLVS